MFGFRHWLAVAGAAMLLVGAVSSSVHATGDVASGLAGEGAGVAFEARSVATVPVLARVRGGVDIQLLGVGDLSRIPLVGLVAAAGVVLVVAALWWLSRPDRRTATPQGSATVAASRAPPVLTLAA